MTDERFKATPPAAAVTGKPTPEMFSAACDAYDASTEMQPREHTQALHEALCAALSAAPSPVDSRDDRDFEWKLVPIKPTLEMAEKGAEAFSLPHPQSVGAENERAALIYRLMLSASPVPAQPIEAAEKWRLFPKKTPGEVDRDPVYREASRQLKPLRDAFMLGAAPEGRPTVDGDVPAPHTQLFGPYGWLNGPRFLAEDSWEIESDPIENNDEHFSIPLYATVEPVFPVTHGTPVSRDGVSAAPEPVGDSRDELIARLRGMIRWAHDTLYEIDTSNYGHDEVCKLNDASVEVILGLAVESDEWLAQQAATPADTDAAQSTTERLQRERDYAVRWANKAVSDIKEHDDKIITTLRKALEPFAKAADNYNKLVLGEDIDHWPCKAGDVTLGDLREARAALAAKEQQP